MKRLVFVLLLLAGPAWSRDMVSITGIEPETIRLRPGFQQDVSIQGGGTIESVHIGDPTVAGVTVVSDKRLVINALPPEGRGSQAVGPRATNVLVRDPNKNLIAVLEVEVGYFASEGSRMVEIHRRVGGGPSGGGGRSDQYQGVDKYVCSSIKCDVVARDKSEAPTQVIQQDNYGAAK